MPLPAPDPDEAMPRDLQELAAGMRLHVRHGRWEAGGTARAAAGPRDDGLPDDLLQGAFATTEADDPADQGGMDGAGMP